MVDTKLTGLATLSSASADDLLYIVDAPTGTPASKGIRVDNFLGFCGASYSTNAGQLITGSYNIIDFEDKTYDTDNAVTTGLAWKFTCPANKGGYYLVNVYINFDASATWDAGENLAMTVFINNAIHKIICKSLVEVSGINAERVLSGSCVVYLSPGDYIDVRVVQNSGGSLTLYGLSSLNHIQISRLLGF